jgi:transcriptional regulator with XRE-family HTH domain
MTNSKKIKQAKLTHKRQQAVDVPVQTLKIGPGHDDDQAKPSELPQPWEKLRVKPDLSSMHASIVGDPPESAIGDRIAYCRGQLDNLSVEALARYTKNFDKDGISRTTIVRYEMGDNIPGGRELRILCDALWIPADWLIFGRVESGDVSPGDMELLEALDARILRMTGHGDVANMAKGMTKREIERKTEQRRKWLFEARQTRPRK